MNTLFVRTILLSMVVLISVHAGVMLLVCGATAGSDESALQTAVVTERSFSGDPLESAAELSLTVPMAPVSLAPVAMKLDLAARPKVVDLHPAVYNNIRLPLAQQHLQGVAEEPTHIQLQGNRNIEGVFAGNENSGIQQRMSCMLTVYDDVRLRPFEFQIECIGIV